MSADALLAPQPPRRFDLVGVGESSLDRVLLLPRLPASGEKLAADAWLELPGGQVATALLAAQRLGLRTALISSLGEDAAAARVLRPLAAAGMELGSVRRIAGAATRAAVILVEAQSGERVVLHHRDAALGVPPTSLARDEVEQGRLLHLDAADPELACWAADVARAAGIPVLLDADALLPGVRALLARVDFPIVPRSLARALAGSDEPADALRALAALGARFPVVTLGDRGALGGAGEPLHSPAIAVAVVDTTGAGDVFHGAFAWALLAGYDAARCLRAANVAAGLACRALGAQGSLPSRAELLAWLQGAGAPPAPEPGPKPKG